MGKLSGKLLCRYTETLRDKDRCGLPATHTVGKRNMHRMAVCAKHAKLYEGPAVDGGAYIVREL